MLAGGEGHFREWRSDGIEVRGIWAVSRGALWEWERTLGGGHDREWQEDCGRIGEGHLSTPYSLPRAGCQDLRGLRYLRVCMCQDLGWTLPINRGLTPWLLYFPHVSQFLGGLFSGGGLSSTPYIPHVI